MPVGVAQTGAPAGHPDLIHHGEGRVQSPINKPSTTQEACEAGAGRLSITPMSVPGWIPNIIAEVDASEAGPAGA